MLRGAPSGQRSIPPQVHATERRRFGRTFERDEWFGEAALDGRCGHDGKRRKAMAILHTRRMIQYDGRNGGLPVAAPKPRGVRALPELRERGVRQRSRLAPKFEISGWAQTIDGPGGREAVTPPQSQARRGQCLRHCAWACSYSCRCYDDADVDVRTRPVDVDMQL